MGLFFVGVALVAMAAFAFSGRSGMPALGFTPIRRRAIQILDELLPAAYPDARFMKIVGPGWTPQGSPPGSSTCGALPYRVGLILGDPHGITRGGVPGVETEGQAKGAWVKAARGRRPKPGDIYLLAYPDGRIAHTGIIVDASGDVWTTADAGQGPALSPRAERVRRQWDGDALTLTREDNAQTRVLVGWIDLDRWPFPSAAQPVERFAHLWWGHPVDPGEQGFAATREQGDAWKRSSASPNGRI